MNTDFVIPTVLLNADRRVYFMSSTKIPDWADSWALPELQSAHLPIIDLGRITRLQFPFGDSRIVTGNEIFDLLKRSGLIGQCFNIRDGASMVAYEYCHYVFRTRVFLWKSVVSDGRSLFVPFVQSIACQPPVIYWWWLEYAISFGDLGMVAS